MRSIIAFVLGALLTVGTYALAFTWSDDTPYTARIRCRHVAEDVMGKLRLIEYDRNPDGTLRLVYRCTRNP